MIHGIVASRLRSSATPGGDPFFESVVSLVHFDGVDGSTSFVDTKGIAWNAAGNAQIDTAQSKFGGSSFLLDGSGDYIATTGSSSFVFGTGDFCAECWIRTSATDRAVLDFYTPSQPSWQVYINGSGRIQFWSSALVATGTSNVSNGTWHHIAVTRASGTVRIFVDGVQEISVSFAANLSTQSTFFAVGAQVSSRNATYDFVGHIDDVRITKGTARYIANFPPPTVTFPDSL